MSKEEIINKILKRNDETIKVTFVDDEIEKVILEECEAFKKMDSLKKYRHINNVLIRYRKNIILLNKQKLIEKINKNNNIICIQDYVIIINDHLEIFKNI